MKTILLTGGCGFIGSHTSLTLLKKGYKVIIVDSCINSSFKVLKRIREYLGDSEDLFCKKVDFYKGDIRNKEFLDEIFNTTYKKGNAIDGVIHFAGLKSVKESIKRPLLYWETNVIGTINLIKVMEKYSCKNLIFSSSATIYGIKDAMKIKENSNISPTNPYGNTKVAVEKILNDLNKSSKEWRIFSLRYFNPIGAHSSGCIGENPIEEPNNIMPIINNVAGGFREYLNIYGNDWETKDGTCIRDYIHVMDLAEGHVLSLEYMLKNNLKYTELNLGTGKGTSILELISSFQEVNKVKVPYKFVARREGDLPYSVADNSLARELLKWNPQRNISEMCADSWVWFRNIKNYDNLI